MSVFTIFDTVLHILAGLSMLLTGLFIWQKFKEDFEARTLGGILALSSIIFFMMALRNLFLGLGWIDVPLALYAFFVEYIFIFSVLLLFGLPRFFYLVFNKERAKQIGFKLGSFLFLIYLVVHFSQREEIIPHYDIPALWFELPHLEKIYVVSVLALVLFMMLYRTYIHFLQWQKTKTFPYKVAEYLLLFFIFAVSSFRVLPTVSLGVWQSVLLDILTLGGLLGAYYVFSQEIIKKEEPNSTYQI